MNILLAFAAVAALGTRTLIPWIDEAGKTLEYGVRPASFPTGCAPFTVDLPREREGAVVDAADFGVSEAIDDNNATLQKAVDHCRKTGAKKLVLKKGTYRFYGPHSVVFDSLTDFTFDAQGSTLVFRRASAWRPEELIWQATFHPEDANLFIRNCERCVFRNYNMDWDWEHDPLATFARVTAVNLDDNDDLNSSVDFELIDYKRHPFYPKPMPFQCIVTVKESRDGFAPNPNRDGYSGPYYQKLCEGGYGRAMDWLSPNRIRFYPAKDPTAPGTRTRLDDSERFLEKKSDPRKGRREAGCYVVGQLYRIAHYYPGKSGIYMEGNRHLTIENENIYSCRGMAHVIDGPQHHTYFHHVHVAPPPGVKRPISATADSMHVANSLGYLKIEDFEVTLNQDDFSNIHDRTCSGRRADVRTVEITHQRGNLYFMMKAGDTLEVRNPDFSPLGFQAKAIAVEGNLIKLDRDIPETMADGSILFNRSRGTDNVWWKDCVIHDNAGRATMMCNNLTFENCTFRNGYDLPIKVQAGFHPLRWAEGMGATNHVYRRCTFENNQILNRSAFGKVVSDIFVGSNIRKADYSADLSKKPWNGAVGDILFEKCRFVRQRGAIAHCYAGHNISFVDNEIVLGKQLDHRFFDYRSSVVIDHVEGVYFSGNRFTSEDKSVKAGLLLPIK